MEQKYFFTPSRHFSVHVVGLIGLIVSVVDLEASQDQLENGNFIFKIQEQYDHIGGIYILYNCLTN